MALLAVTCAGCSKDDKPEEVPAPPSVGGASADVVATEIGSGLGLPSELAPTSTKWEHIFVTSETTAILAGRAADEAIAIRTVDSGRSWKSYRAKVGDFVSWGASGDGALVLVAGTRKKMAAARGKKPTVEKADLWFAAADAPLSESLPFFPNDDTLKGVSITGGIAAPVVHSNELASMLVNRGRASVIAFRAPAGKAQPAPLTPPRGRYIPVPYGRPAQLLAQAGRSLNARAWPQPGVAPAPPKPVLGLVVTPTVAQQLSAGPGCESQSWSFARVTPSPNRAWVVGISEKQTIAIKVPASDQTTLGCRSDAVVVETFDKKKKEPVLVRCPFEGKCAEPKSNPFEVWPEEHKRTIYAAPTSKGVVATMNARVGERWGSYLAQSIDGGDTFELPRVIGEGKAERGAFEVGALINFPDRVVILMSADVTGKSQRRWYVMASDDGGSNWGPP